MTNELSTIKIFRFWRPLAASWFMMAAEAPFVTSIVSRLPEPKYNLAAFGVAFAIALIIEAPIILMLSAAVALVEGKQSFYKLRAFQTFLILLITSIFVMVLYQPIFDWLTLDLMDLPPEIASLTWHTCLVLVPWPGAIGVRRFYQGVLIRSNQTHMVAIGTMTRLITILISGFTFYSYSALPGCVVAGCCMSLAVILEAAATRAMAQNSVRQIVEEGDPPDRAPISYKDITIFYYPLALTSIIGLSVPPVMSFALAHGRSALESLAVLPVLNAFGFIFRCVGYSFQEVVVAMLGKKQEGYVKLRTFTFILTSIVTISYGLILFTPLMQVWLTEIAGLSDSLANFGLLPARLSFLLPALSVLLMWRRGLLIKTNKTLSVSISSLFEVVATWLSLAIFIGYFDLIGVIGGIVSMTLGHLTSWIYLEIQSKRLPLPGPLHTPG